MLVSEGDGQALAALDDDVNGVVAVLHLPIMPPATRGTHCHRRDAEAQWVDDSGIMGGGLSTSSCWPPMWPEVGSDRGVHDPVGGEFSGQGAEIPGDGSRTGAPDLFLDNCTRSLINLDS